MNRLSPLLFLVALVSCTGELDYISESLGVSCASDAGKVQMSGGNAVWNEGDKLTIFYGSTENECWVYSGEDKARTGTISHISQMARMGDEKKYGLFPFSESATLNGSVITTDLPSTQDFVEYSFGAALMTCATTSSNLQFKYANAFIALGLKGLGTIEKAVLKGNDGEIIAGRVNIDLSGENPLLTLDGSAQDTSITVRKEGVAQMLPVAQSVETGLCFCIPPMTFRKGFTVTLFTTSGEMKVCRYTSPVTVERGKVLYYDDMIYDATSVIGIKEILLDFRSGNNPFTEEIVTSTTHHYRESDTVAVEKEHLPDGKQAFTKEGNYDFWIYTHYGLGSDGKPQYGISYNTTKKYVSFGRPGSFMKTPAIPGYYLYSATYEAGSTAGNACFSSTRDGLNVVSNKLGLTEPGLQYTITMDEYVANTSYYLMVNGGNLCFRWWKFIYLPVGTE